MSPFVTNVMLHGANKPFNVAVIVPDMESLKKWATEKGLDITSIPELLKREEVLQLFREQINEFGGKVAKGYEKPQRFLLISEDFTTANDMLTPSLKLKRRNVLKKFGEAVEELYREAAKSGDIRAA
jgi:long-chain acyl-CoA synthetase